MTVIQDQSSNTVFRTWVLTFFNLSKFAIIQQIMAESIKVIVRFRPQNSLEKSKNAHVCIQISPDGTLCQIENPKAGQPVRLVLFCIMYNFFGIDKICCNLCDMVLQ